MLNKLRKFFASWIFCLLCLLPLVTVEAAAENLRVGVTKDNIRLVINVDKPYSYTEQTLGNRLLINLPTKVQRTERILIRDASVRRAYLEASGTGSRLVIVFAKNVPTHKIFLLKNPQRLVVDFPKSGKTAGKTSSPKPVAASNRIVVGPGLVYTKNKVNMGAGNVNTSVLELAPNSSYKLEFVPGYGKTIQKGILSKITERSGAVAAVNASYFDSDIWVIGNLKINQKFLGMEKTPRTGLVLDAQGGTKIIPDLSYTGMIITGSGRRAAITGLNRMRLADEIIYFNDGYDTDTGTNQYGTEVRVRNGMVVEISTKGRMALNSATYVLSGNGAGANFLNTLQVGDKVELRHDLGNAVANEARSVGSAGPLLVNNGRVQVEAAKEEIASDIAWGRSPRTGVGIRADGTVLLVVADGRSRYSVGMSLTELAQYFVRLKAVTAMNFDGGGSSEMVVNDRIMNNPSDGQERPVRVALGVFRK